MRLSIALPSVLPSFDVIVCMGLEPFRKIGCVSLEKPMKKGRLGKAMQSLLVPRRRMGNLSQAINVFPAL
jgi:hypothetical protein